MSANGYIYLLRFPNGKCYIGQTRQSVKRRYDVHAAQAKRGKYKLPVYSAWRKFGAPQCVVLGQFTIDDLNMMEGIFIAACKTLVPSGYNLQAGGTVATVVHASTRAKLSKARRNRVMPADWGFKIAATRQANGYAHSPETRAKIAASKTIRTADEKRQIRNAAARRRRRGKGAKPRKFKSGAILP